MQDAALCVHNIIRRRKASESNAFRLLFALSAQWCKEVSIVSFYCSTVVSALGSHSGSERAAAQSDPFAIKELWHQALTFFVYRTEPVCQVLLLWSCLRKVFFEKLNEVYGGRRRILDAAHHEHDLPVILRHCGTAGHAVGILCEDQLPHISDTQIVFYQREDEVIIAAGVFHTW